MTSLGGRGGGVLLTFSKKTVLVGYWDPIVAAEELVGPSHPSHPSGSFGLIGAWWGFRGEDPPAWITVDDPLPITVGHRGREAGKVDPASGVVAEESLRFMAPWAFPAGQRGLELERLAFPLGRILEEGGGD